MAKIKLSSSHLYGQIHLSSASKEADALFRLMGRGTIQPHELPLLAEAGIECEIVGNLRAYKQFEKGKLPMVAPG